MHGGSVFSFKPLPRLLHVIKVDTRARKEKWYNCIRVVAKISRGTGKPSLHEPCDWTWSSRLTFFWPWIHKVHQVLLAILFRTTPSWGSKLISRFRASEFFDVIVFPWIWLIFGTILTAYRKVFTELMCLNIQISRRSPRPKMFFIIPSFWVLRSTLDLTHMLFHLCCSSFLW